MSHSSGTVASSPASARSATEAARAATPSDTDFGSVLAARQELGAEMQPAVVDSFASQITDEIRRQVALSRPPLPDKPVDTGSNLALAIVSVVMLIPLTGIALGTHSAFALFLIFPSVVVINLAFAWAHHRR